MTARRSIDPAATTRRLAVSFASTLLLAGGVAHAQSSGAIADDLTKEIQKDLIALGYDPGNIQGDLSTETIIAISQFQAENDLEVTGEASPQLAGVIKARLDERNNPAPAAQPQGTPAAQPQGAMQQLTPEQRQALEQSGIGGMFEQLMGGATMGGATLGGATSGQPSFVAQPDKNVVLPETYNFSYRVSMRITNSQGTAEPVFYIQPDAPYYARTQSKNGVTEFLVYDNQRNLAVLFAEKDGKKRRVHNRIGLEAKAALLGFYRDTPSGEPVKSIGRKTILGYPSQGYEISTLAGITQLWITDQAPATLFSTMFEGRADATGDAPLKKHSMIMEITFTSANTPEDNYHMECTQLQPDNLILSKNDYQT